LLLLYYLPLIAPKGIWEKNWSIWENCGGPKIPLPKSQVIVHEKNLVKKGNNVEHA